MKTALITPSYSPDLSRCMLLSKTVERWVDPSIDHIVIVPKRDSSTFENLPSRSHVMIAESILPKFVWQVPFFHKWWLTLCSWPVRGWIMQQLVKLSAAASLDYDVFVFVDSDIVIIRQIDTGIFVKNGTVRLYRVPGEGGSEMHMRWHRTGAKILGLEKRDYFGADYIGPMVSWYKPNLIRMLDHIREVGQKEWFAVLANTLYFGEYLLYGIFADFVIGEEANHFAESDYLCHCHWNHSIDSPNNFERYLDAVEQKHVAILIQSNKGMDVTEYSSILKKRGLI